jgi:hypothetical protein
MRSQEEERVGVRVWMWCVGKSHEFWARTRFGLGGFRSKTSTPAPVDGTKSVQIAPDVSRAPELSERKSEAKSGNSVAHSQARTPVNPQPETVNPKPRFFFAFPIPRIVLSPWTFRPLKDSLAELCGGSRHRGHREERAS